MTENDRKRQCNKWSGTTRPCTPANKEKVFSLVDTIYTETNTTPLEIKVESASVVELKAGKPCKVVLPGIDY